jgi:hypothetical protein
MSELKIPISEVSILMLPKLKSISSFFNEVELVKLMVFGRLLVKLS